MLLSTTFLTVACQSADAQKDVWYKKEIYTYSVEDTSCETPRQGELVMTIEKLVKTDVTAGKYDIKEFNGIQVTSSLTMNATDSKPQETILAKSWFNVNLISKMSYKKYNLVDNTNEISALYDNNVYKYVINDGEEQSMSIKKGNYVDNEALYAILRTFDLDFKNFSATFKIPSPIYGEVQNMQVAVNNSSTEITVPYGTFNSISVAIAMSTKYSGKPFSAYFACEPIEITTTANEAKTLPFVLLKFTENNVTYTLTKIE